jgi:hypothetical protein
MTRDGSLVAAVLAAIHGTLAEHRLVVAGRYRPECLGRRESGDDWHHPVNKKAKE